MTQLHHHNRFLFPSRPDEGHRQVEHRTFNAHETAMIGKYRRLRVEWNRQLDCLEHSANTADVHGQRRAAALNRELAVMEQSLPEGYIYPEDATPHVRTGTIASAFARLLKRHRLEADMIQPTLPSISR